MFLWVPSAALAKSSNSSRESQETLISSQSFWSRGDNLYLWLTDEMCVRERGAKFCRAEGLTCGSWLCLHTNSVWIVGEPAGISEHCLLEVQGNSFQHSLPTHKLKLGSFFWKRTYLSSLLVISTSEFIKDSTRICKMGNSQKTVLGIAALHKMTHWKGKINMQR